VFGEVVAFSLNVGSDFLTVTQADTSDFTKSGVGFFGSHGFYQNTNATFLGVGGRRDVAIDGIVVFSQSCSFDLFGLGAAAFSDELIYGWHMSKRFLLDLDQKNSGGPLLVSVFSTDFLMSEVVNWHYGVLYQSFLRVARGD